ncbi:hypothetical protein F4779DRAFT_270086 [Xylariaceae sp. FL0662B]|nr:hypothetical protein F4779DRAFT_270086 [Xylariaceae sp. FL0662B]
MQFLALLSRLSTYLTYVATTDALTSFIHPLHTTDSPTTRPPIHTSSLLHLVTLRPRPRPRPRKLEDARRPSLTAQHTYAAAAAPPETRRGRGARHKHVTAGRQPTSNSRYVGV